MTSSSSRICISSVAAAALAAGVLFAGDAGAGAREDYSRFCAPCHGEAGDGKGPLADNLAVRPRDFTQAAYKFRSTRSGALPQDEDILRVIDDGLPGTPMPGWRGVLPVERRQALVGVLKAFSPRFAKKAPPPPLELPPEPPADAGAVARGREVYAKMKCADCHGTGGRGDGPSAPTLRDDQGRFIPAYDLTRTELLRAQTPFEVVRVFITGLNGTPMPSYVDAITPEETWDLVRYLMTLRRPVGVTSRLTDDPLIWRGGCP